jgi:DNA-binding NarL/FixJ family response regulator
MQYKIFIVDDHPFTRAGVRSLLESNSEFNIIGEAENGLDAVEQVIQKHPDIVVMDINMPQLSGIDATRKILAKYPEIKIVALSIHKGEIFVKKMLDAGAVGYLLKDEAPEELSTAIQKVIEGNIYLSSAVTRAALVKSDPG